MMLSQTRRQQRLFIICFVFLLFATFTLYVVSSAHGPDLKVSYVSEVHSPLDSNILNQSVWALINWPEWHYDTLEAKSIDILGREYSMRDQTVERGSLIHLTLKPRSRKESPIVLQLKVIEYIPKKILHVQVLKDSSGQLTSLFDQFEWKIEFFQASNGTSIRGSIAAHTADWHSRLFAHLAQRLMMSQFFYPNLKKLSRLKNPSMPNPLLPAEQ